MDLSLVKPDFDGIKEKLVEALSSKNDAWRDLSLTGTGDALISFAAAVGAQAQYAIQHAFLESFRTARLDSSIYRQAELIGVRLNRKLPASCQCRLVSTEPVHIPKFTQFVASGVKLFNRQFIDLTTGEVVVTLYEGEVKTTSLSGTGEPYQQWVSLEHSFAVSDKDLECTIGDAVVNLSPSIKGAAFETTTPEGNAKILFGNSVYGKVPALGEKVGITYAVTKGPAGNNAAFTGSKVAADGWQTVAGEVITGLTGGGGHTDVRHLRRFMPQLASAHNGARSKAELAALAATYPGVIDAVAIGQQDFAPTDSRYMNTIKVCLLAEEPLTDAQKRDFIEWYKQRILFPLNVLLIEPVGKEVHVKATVYCHGRVDLHSTKIKCEEAVKRLLSLKQGSLTEALYISDVYSALSSVQGVEHISLVEPFQSVRTTQPVVEPYLSLDLGAFSSTKRRSYAVTAVGASGEGRPQFSSIDVRPGYGVSLRWYGSEGVTSYKVYGGSFPDIGLLATLPGTVTKWVDDGTITPVLTAPIEYTPTYIKAGRISLSMHYSERTGLGVL